MGRRWIFGTILVLSVVGVVSVATVEATEGGSLVGRHYASMSQGRHAALPNRAVAAAALQLKTFREYPDISARHGKLFS
jgi:hypothetical protein